MWSCLRVICRSISDQKSVSFCWATFCPRRRGFRFANDPQCLLYYYYYYHQLPQNSTSSVRSPPLNNISWGHIFCGFFPIFFFFSIFRPEQSTAMTVSRSANEDDDRTSIWYVPIYVLYYYNTSRNSDFRRLSTAGASLRDPGRAVYQYYMIYLYVIYIILFSKKKSRTTFLVIRSRTLNLFNIFSTDLNNEINSDIFSVNVNNKIITEQLNTRNS
jgi:hypothetical protein